jgi:hypothetical protein
MKYLSSTLIAMTSTANGKEFAGDEGITILAKHEEKTMHTLEVLMNQLNMMYYWEKIRLYFRNNNPSLEQLSKLMNRILKLYILIDNFMKIFKIIEKKEVSARLFYQLTPSQINPLFLLNRRRRRRIIRK